MRRARQAPAGCPPCGRAEKPAPQQINPFSRKIVPPGTRRRHASPLDGSPSPLAARCAVRLRTQCRPPVLTGRRCARRPSTGRQSRLQPYGFAVPPPPPVPARACRPVPKPGPAEKENCHVRQTRRLDPIISSLPAILGYQVYDSIVAVMLKRHGDGTPSTACAHRSAQHRRPDRDHAPCRRPQRQNSSGAILIVVAGPNTTSTPGTPWMRCVTPSWTSTSPFGGAVEHRNHRRARAVD